jgi:eukaryotic-like serine/threonine-protein kinase
MVPGAARSPLWRAGAVIGGRYRLQAPIGAGAMGEVWRADHVSLGTTVAVKLVDTAERKDAQELLARFQLEARAAAQLHSPHVVQIIDHGADGRVAFIAMEYLEGESLADRLERRGRLAPAEVAHVVREMARGIDRAHAAGIVHRDVKPPNVFLARVEGVEIVKVLDFGIAKDLGAPREAQLQTQAGFVVGTPAYMSPEQVLGKPLDHRSDLWQIAIIAFECLTGKRPFDGASLGQLFMAICTLPIPAPSSVAPVPRGFDEWFARATHRDPALRFDSARALAEALGAVLVPEGAALVETGVLPVTGRDEAGATARAEPSRRRAPVAFIAGLVLAPLAVLVVGGVVWLSVLRSPAPVATTSEAPPPPAAVVAAPSVTPDPVVEPPAAPAQTAGAVPSATAAPRRRAGATRPVRAGSHNPSVDLGI